MKKTVVLLSAFFLMFTIIGTMDTFGQADMKEARKFRKKERKEIMKERKAKQALLKQKAVKPARKEAKRLSKEEGWLVFPGDLPIEKQLEEAWMKKEEKRINEETFDEEDAYISAVGNGIATSQSAATMMAIEMAKLQLAGELETKMSSLISINIANAQLSDVEAESLTEIQQSAKNIVATTLKRVKPVLKVYRTPESLKKSKSKKKLTKGNVEVQVTLFYDLYQANFQAQDEIKKVLKDKLKDNENELKKLMGM